MIAKMVGRKHRRHEEAAAKDDGHTAECSKKSQRAIIVADIRGWWYAANFNCPVHPIVCCSAGTRRSGLFVVARIDVSLDMTRKDCAKRHDVRRM